MTDWLSSSPPDFDVHGRAVALIGMAATGLAAARVLVRRGAVVSAHDPKPAEALGDTLSQLRDLGVSCFAGDGAYTGIDAAQLVVPSPGVPMDAPVLQAAVARSQPVLAEIEVAWQIARAPMVGVTGTNGKTTTVFLTAAMLAAAGRDAQVCGNTLAGGFQVPLIQAADEAPADRLLIAEISSFQLEWVRRFRPRVAIVTNITADHLNRHGTVEAYREAKARLLDGQGSNDWAVLNLHDEGSRGLHRRGAARRLWFSRCREVDQGAFLRGPERMIVVREGDREAEVGPAAELPLPGAHNLENVLAAAAAAFALGARPEAIRAALLAFSGVPDRLERVGVFGGVDWINNTMCTNVDAAVRSMEAYERPLIVIAGGRDKGSDFDPLGRALARRAKRLVAIGTDGPQIAAAAQAHGLTDISEASSMQEAVRQAAAAAAPGDVVLLAPACASFDWYSSFEERGRDFRRCVEQLAKESDQRSAISQRRR
jgi:UDP-N-acetylmuramoylalanine--D-glutamate ligase